MVGRVLGRLMFGTSSWELETLDCGRFQSGEVSEWRHMIPDRKYLWDGGSPGRTMSDGGSRMDFKSCEFLRGII